MLMVSRFVLMCFRQVKKWSFIPLEVNEKTKNNSNNESATETEKKHEKYFFAIKIPKWKLNIWRFIW